MLSTGRELLIFPQDELDLKTQLAKLKSIKCVGVDSETTGLDPFVHELRLVQLAAEGYPVLVIDVRELDAQDLHALQDFLAGPTVKILHNAKFDLKFLLKAHLPVGGQLFDTMIAAQLLRSVSGLYRYGLEDLAEHHLGIRLNKENQTSDWSGILTLEQIRYAAEDACILPRLRDVLVKELKRYRLIDVAKLEFD
ncbi:hypothetical protein O9H85_22070 [Paenibacillus filicis]|uniref:3'-5' exonuclease domain-containing protein n=1 Tax=Paenibacillus gyeongsangnamensis TaxID=3388067 RepID=A0ABT4QDW1_9BACL|nr:hypothetical protein [Paenibacillus filicis]MCZ8515059.1 hypothetical protein [Paenibacillus filicis]